MRDTFVTIATGMMKVGKSYQTEILVKEYAKANPTRSVLIFDPNFEDTWNSYPTVHFDIIDVGKAAKHYKKTGERIVTQSERNLEKLPPGIRIIAPYTVYKERMNNNQMLLTMITILNNYRNGLVLLEDVNKYTISFEKSEIQSSFKAIRHLSQDVIMHLQSLNPIRPVVYEATSVLRMHYDRFDLNKIKLKVGDFFTILRIAQLIVRKKYEQGLEIERKYGQNEAYKNAIDAYKRFFLYVYLKESYITGVKIEDFIQACDDYLTENQSEYKSYLTKIAYEQRVSRVTLETHIQARKLWIKNHLSLFKA